MSDRRGRRRGRVADDTWLDDDEPDSDEAEIADRMHISGERWRKLAVFAVVILLLAYAAVTYIQRRDDREEEAAAEEEHHQEAAPAVTTTFASGADLNPIEPTCPEEPYTERAVQFTEAPPTCIDEGTTYVATVETTRGDFEITLDSEIAPIAVNNFVFLARWRYYDGVGFHAAIPRFELTTGDPIGPTAGFGGPGYTIEDEPPPDTEDPPYPVLSVGMSRSADEPGSNGGRFFVVTGDAGTGTPDDTYTRFGHVTDGEEVISEIEATGNREGTPPQDLTVIERITIDERGA